MRGVKKSNKSQCIYCKWTNVHICRSQSQQSAILEISWIFSKNLAETKISSLTIDFRISRADIITNQPFRHLMKILLEIFKNYWEKSKISEIFFILSLTSICSKWPLFLIFFEIIWSKWKDLVQFYQYQNLPGFFKKDQFMRLFFTILRSHRGPKHWFSWEKFVIQVLMTLWMYVSLVIQLNLTSIFELVPSPPS